jgi:DeoR/GlpR family transcriptional regulator of sugar metabolism
MGLEKLNEHHKKNKHHACKMSTDDVLLKIFNENKMLTTKMIYKLVEGSDAEIASAITSLEKQGMIKNVPGGAWIRTDKDNKQPALI